jgi:tRNA A-37 threonylcarbamoyl transferase component Bud32
LAIGAEAAESLIGHEVGGAYQLVEVLGKGGMSIVYRGRHVLTEQEVAVKVLPPELAEQAEVRERFIGEARTLARLDHPNIVRLYNFLQEEGHLYIVMEFAEGDTFDQLITREGRITVADAVGVGIRTLEALRYAHERAVIHRDIKPSNIVIRGDGAVKVMDFGIAKIVGATKLTQTGQTMGTVRYMSPEQVRGRVVDHRTDLYSLGVTLYEACTGQAPFDGDTHFDIMHKHLTEPPRPPGECVQLPAQLDEALLVALRKLPEERFDSADAFKRALERVPFDARSRRITASNPVAKEAAAPALARPAASESPWRARLPGIVAAVMLLCAIAGVVWALASDGQPSNQGTAAVQPPRGAAPAEAAKWPELHWVASRVDWKVDRKVEDEQLRVLCGSEQEAATLVEIHGEMLKRYRLYLQREGIDLDVPQRPLNLAIVTRALFAEQRGWVSPRYEAPSRTLYVDGSKPNYQKTDLVYGFALHFCVPIRELSNERCVELADGFERFLLGSRG